MAKQQGLTEGIADQIDDAYETSGLDERQKAALRWTDAVLDHPGSIPDDVRRAVADHLDDTALGELTLALALFHGLSRVLISLGMEPEEMATTEMPTPGTRT